MITYLCKYTPLELLAALGCELWEPNTDVEDYRNADALIHSSVCTHAKMLIESVLAAPEDSDGRLVLTSCCDSVRRVYDTLAEENRSGMEMLDLPHNTSPASVSRFARELIRLIDRLRKLQDENKTDASIPENPDSRKSGPVKYASPAGFGFRRDILLTKWKENADLWKKTSSQGPYVAILGARVSDQLREKIRNLLPCPVIDLTCGGLRTMPEPPVEAFIDVPDDPPSCGSDECACHGRKGLSGEELLRAYAKALLSQVPCTRMDDVSSRDELLGMGSIIGVVYHSIKFCDYYSFEYADIRRKSELPILKIESDFTSQSEGQLDTRLRAFAEALILTVPVLREKVSTTASHGQETDGGQAMKNIYIGIDSGSTSTNAAALDENGQLLAWSIIRTGARAGTAARNALDDVKRQLGEDAGSIRSVMATGYGREFISFADNTKTEISCHAKGAHFVDPKARTVIDIGGQDSKVICLDSVGNVRNFVMNDKCAAGTGRFLETMARTLELDMEEMSVKGLGWKKDLTISSTCTVFAESEVVGLIAENTDTGDIIHALNKSVAARTSGMVKRVRGAGPYMMTGGVAKNAGVSKEIENRLGESLFIPEHPDLIGAIGAALFAMEQ